VCVCFNSKLHYSRTLEEFQVCVCVCVCLCQSERERERERERESVCACEKEFVCELQVCVSAFQF